MDDLRTRITEEAGQMERRWAHDPRWAGVVRPYPAEQVIRLRGSFRQEHTWPGGGRGGSGICCTAKITWPRWGALPAGKPSSA
jgi:hypothetical protein